MKLGCVITVYAVVEQVWFSFLYTKYNFKINNEFHTLHNILSKGYYQEAGNNKANKCFIFVYLGHRYVWLLYFIPCQGRKWYLLQDNGPKESS